MSLFQDVTTGTQRPSPALSILRLAWPHRNAREVPVDRAADRQRSQVRGIWQVIGLWLRRRNDRAILRSFSERDLHDFCPRHGEAEAEMNKPFWRA